MPLIWRNPCFSGTFWWTSSRTVLSFSSPLSFSTWNAILQSRILYHTNKSVSYTGKREKMSEKFIVWFSRCAQEFNEKFFFTQNLHFTDFSIANFKLRVFSGEKQTSQFLHFASYSNEGSIRIDETTLLATRECLNLLKRIQYRNFVQLFRDTSWVVHWRYSPDSPW